MALVERHAFRRWLPSVAAVVVAVLGLSLGEEPATAMASQARADIYDYDGPVDSGRAGDAGPQRGPADILRAAHQLPPLSSMIQGASARLGDAGVAPNTERLLARADRIEQHLVRLDHSPANDAMLARLRSAATEGTRLSRADRAFMRHETTEAWLMDRGLGWDMSHRIAGWTHRTFGNYDPSVIKQFPEHFGSGWKRYWGIE